MASIKSASTRIIAVANCKGGVGKTTTSVNLSAGLAAKGIRTLLVDIDYQANASRHLLPGRPTSSMYDSLVDETVPLPRITIKENLDLVPADDQKMFGIGFPFTSRAVEAALRGEPSPDPRKILSRCLAPIASEYGNVIIDCPPSDSLLALNALFAADEVLIPVKPEPFGIYGAMTYVNALTMMLKEAQKAPVVNGYLLTDYETGSTGHSRCEELLRKHLQKLVYQTRIRHSRPLYNASLVRQDIFLYAHDSNGAKDYANFVEEFTNRLNSNEKETHLLR